MAIYLCSVSDNLNYMISEVYRLFESNDVDFIRTINRYIRLHFSWIATISGYDFFIPGLSATISGYDFFIPGLSKEN